MTRYQISAHYIRNSLNLSHIEQKYVNQPLFNLLRKERNLLVYGLGENRYLCVYGFGVITIFGLDDHQEINKLVRFCAECEPEEREAFDRVAPEDYAVVVDPSQAESVEFDHVRLKELTIDKVLLICHVVSQSVAIDFIDYQLKSTTRLFDKIHEDLAKRGRLVVSAKTVFMAVGTGGSVTGFLLNRLSLLDKPEITWEEREAETLYNNLRRMFELDDRFSDLRMRLDFVRDSSTTFLSAIDARRAAVLEIIIILLIAFEVIMAIPTYF